MNILFCSVGRRCELINDFKKSAGSRIKIVAADNSPYAPALYFADKAYLVPLVKSTTYIERILEICKAEQINAVTTFIDPEIEILANNREKFEKINVEVLAPYSETASFCFDKYKMFKQLVKLNIPTIDTYANISEFNIARAAGKIEFPVFVKPRTGSGSVGALRVEGERQLNMLMQNNPSLIIQRLMRGTDIDADVYVDTISHRAVSAFLKRKIETKIGGASKTISFKDDRLFEFIKKIVSAFRFNGPVDMDFFYQDNTYYLSEVNPRFGGAYLHAFGAGVDFIKLILNNINQIENKPTFGSYSEGVVMMMYDSVVIKKPSECITEPQHSN